MKTKILLACVLLTGCMDPITDCPDPNIVVNDHYCFDDHVKGAWDVLSVKIVDEHGNTRHYFENPEGYNFVFDENTVCTHEMGMYANLIVLDSNVKIMYEIESLDVINNEMHLKMEEETSKFTRFFHLKKKP